MTKVVVEAAGTSYSFNINSKNYKSVTTKVVSSPISIMNSEFLLVRSVGLGTLTATGEGGELNLKIDKLLVLPFTLTNIVVTVDDTTFITVGR